METRKEAITFYKKLAEIYEDHPFHDDSWTVMCHRDTEKILAYIFEKGGHIWVNAKHDME